MKRQGFALVEHLCELAEKLTVAQDAAGSDATHTIGARSTGPCAFDHVLESKNRIGGFDSDDSRIFIERRTLDGNSDMIVVER